MGSWWAQSIEGPLASKGSVRVIEILQKGSERARGSSRRAQGGPWEGFGRILVVWEGSWWVLGGFRECSGSVLGGF